MRLLTAFISFVLLSVSAVWAQTATPGSPPATDATPSGGIANYWWIILLVIVIAAAVWYFSSRRTRI